MLPGLAGSTLSLPALAQVPSSGFSVVDLSTGGVSMIVIGLVVFAATTSVLYVRERTRWHRRELDLAARIEASEGQQERLWTIIAAEPQVVVSWAGKGSQPLVEGESGFLGGPGPQRALAFGSWAPPAEAKRLETGVEALKQSGEAFAFTVRTKTGQFVEAEGRPVAGRAVLRLREVTGARGEALRLRDDLACAAAGEATLRGLLAALPQPVWMRDADGRLSWTNAAYAKAVEAGDPERAAREGIELLDREARENAARARREGTAFSARAPVIVAGERRTLDILETPTPGGFAGIATDMSELEAVRADLQRQMDAHVRTLDRVKTAVAVFDGSQRLVYWNAGYEHLWSLDEAFLQRRPTDGEILDRLRTERRLPELGDFRAWKTEVQGAYTSLRTSEDWWYLPDGRTVHVVTSPNPQGGVTYLYDDATERFSLESRFNALSRTQRETLDSLREGVAVFGSDGRLRLSNPAFAQLWKLPPECVQASPHIDEVVRLCQPLFGEDEIWTEVRSAVSGVRDAREDHLYRMERRDGSVLDCSTAPLPDGATLISFADVTASVNVERALTEKNDALEKAGRLRDDFVHHVSYELRSPLTNIIGFAQLLGEETIGALNERQRDYTSHIVRSSGALLAIINDILDLASIDNGALALDLQDVDVAATIAEASAGLHDRLTDSKLTLEVEIAPNAGPLRADGKRLRQVLFNLISNAIGFSSPGQTIRITAGRSGQDLRITVADEGRGIPPEVKAKVFDRFESHSLGSRHRGVGLGLSMVRSIVELHGGHVELDSAPGRGTRITVVFPPEGLRLADAAE